MVKRYEPHLKEVRGEDPTATMLEWSNGDWIEFGHYEALAAELDKLKAKSKNIAEGFCIAEARYIRQVKALEEALTPSGDTKAAYIGEHQIEVENAEGGSDMVLIPWTTVKDIMAMILDRAKEQAGSNPASVLTEQRDAAGSGTGVLTVPHRSLNREPPHCPSCSCGLTLETPAEPIISRKLTGDDLTFDGDLPSTIK